MAKYIKQGDIFGRIGSGIGQGLSEQLPKEIERGRLSAGLENLGQQKGLTPFQQFAGLVGTGAYQYPQILQSGTDLLRQQAIIDDIKQSRKASTPTPSTFRPYGNVERGTPSATTTSSTEAALNPHIPPSGEQQEYMARQLMAEEPLVYPNIEAARQGVTNRVNADIQRSNALLNKRELEKSVQSEAEQKLRDQIATVGADVPPTLIGKLQEKAVADVAKGNLSTDQAKVKYGDIATGISRDFNNVKSWGDAGLFTHNLKNLQQSMRSLQHNAKKGNYRKEAADAMIAENGFSPEFAYANLYPVNEVKELNQELKDLPDIKPRLEKAFGAGPGLAGVGFARPKNANAEAMTLDVAPRLAEAMGFDGSPLAISYELDKKGYDPQVWKKYLLDNLDSLNLTSNQIDELQKSAPGYFSWLNDWLFKSFSGVK